MVCSVLPCNFKLQTVLTCDIDDHYRFYSQSSEAGPSGVEEVDSEGEGPDEEEEDDVS